MGEFKRGRLEVDRELKAEQAAFVKESAASPPTTTGPSH